MKTRLSILAAVLCWLAHYSHIESVAASRTFESSRLSASQQPPPSDFFDPLGLVSPSQHGQLTCAPQKLRPG
jgi:hypothetical protein